MREIEELRILPPLAIGRLGDSNDPMDNYDLEVPSPLAWRQIKGAETLVVDSVSGAAHWKLPPFDVAFRDSQNRIRPVSPFLEVWVRLKGEDELIPLTTDLLHEAGVTEHAVRWTVHVANWKAYRRTRDNNDKVEAIAGPFSDHSVQPLQGKCPNFFPNKYIPLGSVQYVAPSPEIPEIRLRFTPAAGKVYGPPLDDGQPDPNLAGEVYNPAKGGWKGYIDPINDPAQKWKATMPLNTYAGTVLPSLPKSELRSWGYLDDECDGIVAVELAIHNRFFTAFARIAAGPPGFAPDSLPVRTLGDELEQAMFGPDLSCEASSAELRAEVRDIVRRALDTVRLMNTSYWNGPNAGMAYMDTNDCKRALEPIVNPALADSLAIRARHERVLIALDSGTPAWFARILRRYDQVGDLTNEGRQRMPALMRGADARHLALTRRQFSKTWALNNSLISSSSEPGK